MPTASQKKPPNPAPESMQVAVPTPRRSSHRLLPLLVIGLVLIPAALTLRSSRWMREPILRNKSVPELEVIIRERPEDALAHYYLAKGYYLQYRFGEAESAYKETVRLDPDSARARLGLALSLYELGRTQEAREAFERTLQLDDRLAWAEYMLGKLLWGTGDVKGALPHVRRATELDPRSDQAWYGLAACYTHLRRHNEAIHALRQAVARRGDSAKYHTALGELLVFRGYTDEGRTHYEHALQLDSNYGPACALLGSLYLTKVPGLDSLNRAEALLTRASRLETPRPADIWFDLGQVHIQKAQYPKAVQALQASLKENARDERVYYALANAFRRMGDAKAAAATEARFRKISALHVRMLELEARVAHNPNSAAAHADMARVYRDLGLTSQAARHFDAVIQMEPPTSPLAEEGRRFFRTQGAKESEERNREFVLPSPR